MTADVAFLLVGFSVLLLVVAVLVRWNVAELAAISLGRRLLLLALIAPTLFIILFKLRSAWSPALAQPVVVQPAVVQPLGPPTLVEDLFPLAVGLRWTMASQSQSFIGGGMQASWELEVTGKERAVIDGVEVEVFRIELSPLKNEVMGATDEQPALALVDATQVRIYTKADSTLLQPNSRPRLTPEGLMLARTYPRRCPREGTWRLVPHEANFEVSDGSKVLGAGSKLPFDLSTAVAITRSGCNPQACTSLVVVLVPGVGRVYESQAYSAEPQTSWSVEKRLQRFHP